MMPSHNLDNIVLQIKRLVESDKRSEIRLNANGGNSILIVCEPGSELEYIAAIEKLLDTDKYNIIDLNVLLNQFVESNKLELDDKFELLKGSVNQIFRTPAGEDSPDLFSLIIQTIAESLTDNKIPVLINSGTLYGSGIDNIHIMENKLIMNASLPLIVLYPATKDGDKLLFLSKRPSSKYRCMIIDEK